MSHSRSAATRPIKNSNLDAPQWFQNREMSWLEFNQRVLEEAQDESNPPLERLKFLAIVTSNLDEFFEIRVAGLQRQAETRPDEAEIDGLGASDALDCIAARAKKLVADQYECYRDQVVPALSQAGIDLFTVDELDERGRAWAAAYFAREVFPVLTPLAVDPAHPFPQLANKSLNLVVELRVANREGEFDGMLRDDQHVEFRLGVVQVPRILPRLISVPPEFAPKNRKIYLFLSSLISAFIGQLFPGLEVRGCYAFRLTRNSELFLNEDEADNLLEAMQEQLARRRKGDAVRLEVQRGADPSIISLLLETFELDAVDLYEVDGPINLTRLMAIYSLENRPDLKDAPFTSQTPPQLKGVDSPDEFFAAIRAGDILLHHPYGSFRPVVKFIQLASEDPQVLAIKITLYRTSKDSPIVHALMRAAQNGKQVTALVELKARFDEENNIAWAKAMEDAGVHVVYGLVGLKTHSKLAFVVRREEEGIQRYIHLGTGNYNEVTARIYTDLGLLTANPEIGDDAGKIFNLLTGMSQFPGLNRLMMAPFGLEEAFTKRIDRLTALAKKQKRSHAQNGNGASEVEPPRIIAKMNALLDPGVIKALYRASQAGVRVDLIVRGMCALRPGVPGLSDNIRVRSIIGRFLEHSRVFYFEGGGEEEVLCGSADWMPRNFFRRVEVIFPILNAQLRERVKREVLFWALEDNTKARELLPDGTHKRVTRGGGEVPRDLQAELLRLSAPEKPLKSAPEKGERAAPPAQLKPVSKAAALRISSSLAPVDGLPGTGADPVLQSLQHSQSLSLPRRVERIEAGMNALSMEAPVDEEAEEFEEEPEGEV